MEETRVKYSTDESYSRFDNTRSVQVGGDYCCNCGVTRIMGDGDRRHRMHGVCEMRCCVTTNNVICRAVEWEPLKL